MATLSETSHRLPIHEILDHILGFLKSESNSLRSCALASRSLTSTAQSHLFNHIDFSARTQELEIAAAHRLAELLHESSHLKRYIISILLSHMPAVIAVVADMRLTHLQHISFLLTPLSPPDAPQGSLFSFLNSVPFDTPNQSRPQYASRVEIEQIHITTSFRVLGPFLGSQSSLDFSKLNDVTASRSASRELVIVLQSAKSTIQRLTCDASDLTVFDLNGFSALSDLHIKTGQTSQFLSTIPSLSQLGSTNVVQHMTFVSDDFHFVGSSQALLATIKHLDTQLAALPWPALLTVGVHAPYHPSDVRTGELAQILTECMPTMEKIARLVVMTSNTTSGYHTISGNIKRLPQIPARLVVGTNFLSSFATNHDYFVNVLHDKQHQRGNLNPEKYTPALNLKRPKTHSRLHS
ncbi:hypothetical protein C8J57DRAFT_1222417 [Mycena rebaudengoi]|nr:hypothetical protein C8J57DRAFT_1222417 [Mycena rebaudengoi]